MQAEVLKRIIDKFLIDHEPSALSEYIVSILTEEKELLRAVQRLRQLQSEEDSRRQEYNKQASEEWQKIQERCPHWEFTYHSDPAGGNDSFHECNICKKQW